MNFRMTSKALALTACLTLPGCILAQGMGSMSNSSSMPGAANKGSSMVAASGSATMVAPSHVFDTMLSGAESEIVGAAEAMPAEKFNFAPSNSMGKFDGVRTYAGEIKHVTEANYGMFHALNIPGGKSRAEIEKLTSRDEVLTALKDSYKYVHAVIATITAQNAFADVDGKGGTRAGLAAYSIAHNNDHYGQMIEYLRMNGITPPASRR